MTVFKPQITTFVQLQANIQQIRHLSSLLSCRIIRTIDNDQPCSIEFWARKNALTHKKEV